MDLTEKVAEAVRKVWDEYPNPITHHNLPMVRQDAARAAIAVCAEEMAKAVESEGDALDVNQFDLRYIASAIRSMGEKGE